MTPTPGQRSLIHVSQPQLDEPDPTENKIKKLTDNFLNLSLDVTNYGSCKSLVSFTKEKFGRVDVLVNYAALYGALKSSRFEDFDESLRSGIEIFHNLKKELQENNFSTSVGDEGGFAPDISDTKKALDFICSAVEKSGYKMGEEIFIAMDLSLIHI